MEKDVTVTNSGLTVEDIRDKSMWINLVLDGGRPLYCEQPFDE